MYDVVDDDTYKQTVNSRREREDFVVDDGELGARKAGATNDDTHRRRDRRAVPPALTTPPCTPMRPVPPPTTSHGKDGIGYHDDGEEHMFDPEDGKKKDGTTTQRWRRPPLPPRLQP